MQKFYKSLKIKALVFNLESRLIEELLNSNGNSVVNSIEVDSNTTKPEQNQSNKSQNGTNNRVSENGVNDCQESTTENDKASNEVQIEANINIR